MSSVTQDIDLFVREALLRGVGKDQIRDILVQAGWGQGQIDQSLGAYADVAFSVPVPKPRVRLSARDAFLYLLMFGTLYYVAFAFGSLVFDFINRAFPETYDEDTYRSMFWDSIRWSVSTLLVAFPIFLYLARTIAQQVARNPVMRLSGVRRWLSYMTMLIAAAIMIGDVVTLVYNVLGGENSARFFLKVLTVGGIAGTIFGYYMGDLRKDEK